MSKLRQFSGKGLCTVLESHGFLEVRRRGSHIIMQANVEGVTVTVPVLNHKELKKGTPTSIIRQSGLSRLLFEV